MSGINKKAGIAAGAVWLSAIFLSLWFMGVLSFGEKSGSQTGAGETAAGSADGQARVWEIVFSGMKFTLPQKGKALIHESGCFNIRQNDHYLIQIQIEEDTLDQMWENMGAKRQSLIESGYRMEKEAERMTDLSHDRIRYVVSLEKERGSDFDRSYFEILLAPADEGRHFLAFIRYDGLDVDRLDEAAREQVYDEALAAAEAVIDTAHPTNERDDEPGMGWIEDVSLDPEREYLTEDTFLYEDGAHLLYYRLPDGCRLVSDNVAGKGYLDTVNQVRIQISVMNYTWLTAKDMADRHFSAELSRIHTEGEIGVNGRPFYYYTYSVMEYEKSKTTTYYYFNAYCDLEDGSIYSISGYAEDCPAALEEIYYLDWMNVSLF